MRPEDSCADVRGLWSRHSHACSAHLRIFYLKIAPGCGFRCPLGIGNLHTAITAISLHAISASNVECFNQTVYFDKHGASVPVSRQAGTSSYLVAPLSISGEGGSEYLPEFQPSYDAGAGRYSLHNGRIILTPARSLDDRLDTYVNLRLWVTAGARANGVGAGKVQVL